MWRHIAPAFKMMIVMTVLTGLIYPGVVTGLCQVFFHHQANGSMVRADGRQADQAGQPGLVGSSLIGQSFSRPEYFHPRPSAAETDTTRWLRAGRISGLPARLSTTG